MDLLLFSVKGVDPKAYLPLASLIRSFLENHQRVGSIEICRDCISFNKAYFFTVGKISYLPYGLIYRDGFIYYEGDSIPNCVNDNLLTYLVNAIASLRPGYVVKI